MITTNVDNVIVSFVLVDQSYDVDIIYERIKEKEIKEKILRMYLVNDNGDLLYSPEGSNDSKLSKDKKYILDLLKDLKESRKDLHI